MRKWLLIILLCGMQTVHSQTSPVDMAGMLSRAEYWLRANGGLDSAKYLAENVFAIAESRSASKEMARADLLLREVQFKKSRLINLLEADSVTLKLCRQSRDSILISRAYFNLGFHSSFLGQQKEAVRFFESALQWAGPGAGSSLVADICNNLGVAYMEMGNYDQELFWQTRALTIAEKTGDERIRAAALDNIAGLYLELGQKQKSIDYIFESARIREKLGNYEDIAASYNDVAQILHVYDSMAVARVYADRGLKYAGLSGMPGVLAHAWATQTLLYNHEHNNREALAAEKKAISILESSGNNIMLSRRYISAAILSQSKEIRDSALALVYYQKALDLSSEIHAVLNLRDAYLYRSQFYKSQGNFEKALDDFKNYIRYKDSIISEETRSRISEIQTRYETEKKDLEISRLMTDQRIRQLEIEKKDAIIAGNLLVARQKQDEIALLSREKELQKAEITQQEQLLQKNQLMARNSEQQLKLAEQEARLRDREIRNQKNMRNILIGALALLVLTGWLLFNRYQLKRKIEQQSLLTGMRNSIARDLHDEIGSTLNSIRILSEVSQNNLEKDPAKASGMIHKITEQSGQMQQGMSDIVWAIRPDNDRLGDMVVRMRGYISQTLEPLDIQTHFSVADEVLRLPVDMKQRRDLFLIFKEAVNNIAKYAGAHETRIELSAAADAVLLRIRDNGKGFIRKDLKAANGLRNMETRALSLNGTCTIESVLGQGTTVTIRFPATS